MTWIRSSLAQKMKLRGRGFLKVKKKKKKEFEVLSIFDNRGEEKCNKTEEEEENTEEEISNSENFAKNIFESNTLKKKILQNNNIFYIPFARIVLTFGNWISIETSMKQKKYIIII